MGRLLALALLGALLAAACGGAEPAPSSAAAGVLDGRTLYAQSCASCHGADLEGTATGPPFLNVIYVPGHHADPSFLLAVRNGVRPHHWNFGPMAPVPGLTEAQVSAIVAYVRAQQQAAGIR